MKMWKEEGRTGLKYCKEFDGIGRRGHIEGPETWKAGRKEVLRYISSRLYEIPATLLCMIPSLKEKSSTSTVPL